MAKSKEERIRFANDEILASGNLAAVEDIFAADYLVHSAGRDYAGTDFVRRFARQLRAAIPDIRVKAIALLMDAGDTVVWQRCLSGTHEGDLQGIPASGQKVEWWDMHVTRFEGEKIAEEWAVSDLAGELLLKLPKR